MPGRRALPAVLAAALVAGGCGGAAEQPAKPVERLALVAAPGAWRDACRAAAARFAGTVLCPARLPAAAPGRLRPFALEFGARPEAHERCAWQVSMQIAGFERARGGAFHVLASGQCRPLSLDAARGRWPADPAGVERRLGLVGSGPLRPGERGARFRPVRPRLLGRAAVRGHPAVVVAYGAYPASGTVHGGHQALVWNERGSGHAVSAHFARRVPATRRLAVLHAIATSARPA
jgi:hypothetical protein